MKQCHTRIEAMRWSFIRFSFSFLVTRMEKKERKTMRFGVKRKKGNTKKSRKKKKTLREIVMAGSKKRKE